LPGNDPKAGDRLQWEYVKSQLPVVGCTEQLLDSPLTIDY
jgi:hypothetical protein